MPGIAPGPLSCAPPKSPGSGGAPVSGCAPAGGDPARGGAGAPAGGDSAEGDAGAPIGLVEVGTGIVAWEEFVAATVPAIGTAFSALSSAPEQAAAMRSTVAMRDIVLIVIAKEFSPMLGA